MGLDLYPVLMTLREWGDRYLAEDGPPLEVRHKGCGASSGASTSRYPTCITSPPISSSVFPIGGIGLSRMMRAMWSRLWAHQELVRCV
jgi:hypothetical protein